MFLWLSICGSYSPIVSPYTIARFTCSIRSVTGIPRGQASAQLKIVRQRHTPLCCPRIPRRSAPPWSRLSKMKRWALTMEAGPTQSGLPHTDGHEPVQAPQRIHFVPSSYRARSAGLCRRSVPGSESYVIKYGLTDLYLSKNGSISTTRSLMTGKPSIGSIVTLLPTSRISTLQARRLRPLMRMASEPQTPCAQERRYVSVPSIVHLIVFKASSRRSMGSASTRNSSQYGLRSFSGSKRLMRINTCICNFSNLSIFSFFGDEDGVFDHLHVFVIQAYVVGFSTPVGKGVFEPVDVVALLIVGAVMCAATLGTCERAMYSGLRAVEQEAKFDGFDHFGIECFAFVLELHIFVGILQAVERVQRVAQTTVIALDEDPGIHFVLQRG